MESAVREAAALREKLRRCQRTEAREAAARESKAREAAALRGKQCLHREEQSHSVFLHLISVRIVTIEQHFGHLG